MAPYVTLIKTERRSKLTPMVVSGTHSLDLSLWLFGDKTPVELYAKSVDTALAGLGTKDATFGLFTFDDNSLLSMNISWALPKVWPAATYTIELGIVGTKGVITVDDTHRDLVMATEEPHPTHRTKVNQRGIDQTEEKHISFLASYPPGDMVMGQLWGGMREETNSWLSHLYTGLETPHATAAEGHRNLILTKAMDYSAKIGKAIPLPIEPEELEKP
jgi:predicted dehydrogenase